MDARGIRLIGASRSEWARAKWRVVCAEEGSSRRHGAGSGVAIDIPTVRTRPRDLGLGALAVPRGAAVSVCAVCV